jgi:ParB family transcriptional regulator, chromosome partitioning protein
MTIRSERQQGLGRGLAALIPQRAVAPGTTDIPISRITTNPWQPRKQMTEDGLQALAASIAEHGVLQPIVVTETLDGYRLIAGERRLRAARMAGLERIPAVIRQLEDHQHLELALVENLQRSDLGPLEEAQAFRQLIDEFGFTQETVAVRVGRARSTIANTLRLLDLDPAVQQAIIDGRLTEGHGRALLGLPGDVQARLISTVVDGELSVRQTEELVRRLRQIPAETAATNGATKDPDLERVEEELRNALGTKVSMTRTRRGGRIVIEYYGEEELHRLYARLTGAGA